MSPSDIAYITRTAEKIALTVSLSMTVYRPSHWPNRRVQTRPPNAIALKPPTVRSANNQCGRSSKRIIRAARGALLVIGKNHAVSWTAPSHWGANTSTSWNGLVRHSGDRPPMSALGQKQTLGKARLMSALPPKADIGTQSRNVRFVPKADIPRCGKNVAIR